MTGAAHPSSKPSSDVVAERSLTNVAVELTRRPVCEIEADRALFTTPFGDGKSYEQVVRRATAWLDDVVRDYARHTVLVHRATFYALEHLVNAVPLRDAVLAP